jgi:hypothetical protein
MSPKVLSCFLMTVFLAACGAHSPGKASTLTADTANEVEKAALMIAVEKDTVAAADVQQPIKDLNYKHTTAGTCYAEETVTEYIDYTEFDDEAPYYGVAFVDLTYSCVENARAYAQRVEADNRYQIYSNPTVGGEPLFGVSN